MQSPTYLLESAWKSFKTHYDLYISIYAIPAVLTLVFSLYTTFGYGDPDSAEVTASLLVFILAIGLILANVLMAIAMIRAVSAPEGLTVKDAYAFAYRNFFSYLLVAVLYGLAVTAGFILLIIPGIIFMVWFTFSYFTLLLEGRKGTEALATSKRYVKGKWWPVFGRMLLLLLVAMIFNVAVVFVSAFFSGFFGKAAETIIPAILNAFIVPFTVAYVYYLYLDVRRGQGDVTTSDPTNPQPIATSPDHTQNDQAPSVGNE